jgi:hypothetical protein
MLLFITAYILIIFACILSLYYLYYYKALIEFMIIVYLLISIAIAIGGILAYHLQIE